MLEGKHFVYSVYSQSIQLDNDEVIEETLLTIVTLDYFT